MATNTTTTSTDLSIQNTIQNILEKCDDLEDILTTDDLTFSHIRDIESLAHKAQLLIDACDESEQSRQRMLEIQQNLRNEFFHAFENNTQYKSEAQLIVNIHSLLLV